MTLSEIETILLELTARHKNLTEELLTTLLNAAGWEEKTIKEVLVLFRQNVKSVVVPAPEAKVPQSKNEISLNEPTTVNSSVPSSPEIITFYQPDGTEEGPLNSFTDPTITQKQIQQREQSIEPEKPLFEKKEVITHEPLPLLEGKVEDVSLQPEEVKVDASEIQSEKQVVEVSPHVIPTVEPQSLIIHDEKKKEKEDEKNVPLPENLPLLPFESSPHVWSFNKYKDVFHKDAQVKEEIKVITVMPEKSVTTASSPLAPKVVITPESQGEIIQKINDTEVVIKSVPFKKEDKPLVFLAVIMLFAIILILGYMYSNGRL